MTEYQVFAVYTPINGTHGECAITAWQVQSTDDAGDLHLTTFSGPLAEARARWYAEHMNKNNAHPVIYPGE